MSKKVGDVSSSHENVKATVKKEKSDVHDETGVETRNISRLTSYTVSKKLQVVKWHKENGGNFSKTSRQFEVDRKRIRDWVRKESVLLQHNHGKKKFLRKIHPGGPVFSKELDGALYEYLQRKRNAGCNVSNQQLSQEALRIAERLGVKTSKFLATCQYLCRWKIRYNVTSTKAIKNVTSTRSARKLKTVKNIKSVTPTDVKVEIPTNIKIESQVIPEDNSKTIGSDPVPITLLEVQYIQQGENVYKVLVPKEISERQEEQESILPNSTQPVNPIICQVQDLSKFQELCGGNVETPHLTSFVSLSSQFQTLKSLVRLKVKSDSSGNQVVVPATTTASTSIQSFSEHNPKVQSISEELLGPLLKSSACPRSASDPPEQVETQTKTNTKEPLPDKSEPDYTPCHAGGGGDSVFEPVCDLATDVSQNSSVLESDQCSDYSAQETNKLCSASSSEGSSNMDGQTVARRINIPVESMPRFKKLFPNVLPFLPTGTTKTFVIRSGAIPVGTLSATANEHTEKVAAVSPTFSLMENIKDQYRRISEATRPVSRSVLIPGEQKHQNAFFNVQIRNSALQSHSISGRGTENCVKETSQVADTGNKSPIIVKVNSLSKLQFGNEKAKTALTSVSGDTQTVTHSSTSYTKKFNPDTDGTCSAKQSMSISSISGPVSSAFSSEAMCSARTGADLKIEEFTVSNAHLSRDKMCDSDNAINESRAPQGKSTPLVIVASPASTENKKLNIDIPVQLQLRKVSVLDENQRLCKYRSIFPKPEVSRPKSMVKTEALPIMERSVSIIRRVVKRPMLTSTSKVSIQTGSSKTVAIPSKENQPKLTANALDNPENTAVSTPNSTNSSTSGAKVAKLIARKKRRKISKKKPRQQESSSVILTNSFGPSGPSHSDKPSSSSSDSEDSEYNIKPDRNDFSYKIETQRTFSHNNNKGGCDLSESSSSDVESYKCRAIELQMEFDRKKALNIRRKCAFPKRSLLKDHSFMSSELKAIKKAIVHFQNKILKHKKKDDDRNLANDHVRTDHAGNLANVHVRADHAEKLADRFVRIDHGGKLANRFARADHAGKLANRFARADHAGKLADRFARADPAGKLADRFVRTDPAGKLADRFGRTDYAGKLVDHLVRMDPAEKQADRFVRTDHAGKLAETIKPCVVRLTRLNIPSNIPISAYAKTLLCSAVSIPGSSSFKVSEMAPQDGSSETFRKTAKLENDSDDTRLVFQTKTRSQSPDMSGAVMDTIVNNRRRKVPKRYLDAASIGDSDNPDPKLNTSTACRFGSEYSSSQSKQQSPALPLNVTEHEEKCEQVLRSNLPCDTFNNLNASAIKLEQRVEMKCATVKKPRGRPRRKKRGRYSLKYQYRTVPETNLEEPSSTMTGNYSNVTHGGYEASKTCGNDYLMDKVFIKGEPESPSEDATGNIDCETQVDESVADIESSSVSSFVHAKSGESSRSSMGVEGPSNDVHISGVTYSDADDIPHDDMGIHCGVETDNGLKCNKEPECVSNNTEQAHISNDKYTSLMKMIQQKEQLLQQYREKFCNL